MKYGLNIKENVVLDFVSLGGRCGNVPEGQLTIAQRFNAGSASRSYRVPKGRLSAYPTFSRPFGTCRQSDLFPALKRRAISIVSLRDRIGLPD